MLRTLLSLFILTITLLNGGMLPQKVETALEKVSKKEGVVPVGNLKEGTSGIVIHSFDKNHEAIVAAAIVKRSDKESSTVEFVPFKELSQHKLPAIKVTPAIGDKLLLGYLYDRVLPIVPNAASFKKAKDSFPELTLVHPDLFAVELASERDALPHKNNFQKVCTKLHLGLVMFMYKDGTSFVDCKSWKRVGRSEVTATEGELVAPFFNRFGEIEPPFYDFSDYKLKDFDKFYKKVEGE